MTAPTNGAGVQFAKRVTVIGSAALVVITLGNALGGLAIRTMVMPVAREIMAEERSARVRADSLQWVSIERQARSIEQISSDRIAILEILDPTNSRSNPRVNRLRRRWAREKS